MIGLPDDFDISRIHDNDYVKEVIEQQEKNIKNEKEFIGFLKGLLKERYKGAIKGSDALAKLLETFEYDSYGFGDQHSFTWSIDKYVDNKMKSYIKKLVEVSVYLLENNHTSKENDLEVGGGDRCVYLLQSKDTKRRALVYSNQNIDAIFILEEKYGDNNWTFSNDEDYARNVDLHIRFIYDDIEDALNDEYRWGDFQDIVNNIKNAKDDKDIIRNIVNELKTFQSYGFNGWYSLEQPTLKDYIENDFTGKGKDFAPLRYLDSRDAAYIYSFDSLGGRSDYNWGHLRTTAYLSFDISCMYNTIKGEE